MTAGPDDTLSRQEVARAAGVRPAAVNNWARRHPHEFPPPRVIAGQTVYSAAQVAAWLDSRKISAGGRHPGEAPGATYGQRFRRNRNMPPVAPISAEAEPTEEILDRALWKPLEDIQRGQSIAPNLDLLLALLAIRRHNRRFWVQLTSSKGAGALDLRELANLRHQAAQGLAPAYRRLERAMKDNVDIAAFARPIDEAADQVRLRARRHDVAEGFESLASRFLLEQTAAAHGPRGGEHVTPLSLSRTIVALLDPQPNARICDPCCVSGELLIAAGTWNRLPGPAVIGRSVLDGSALSPMSRQLTLLSAAIRGLRIDVGASPREPLKGEAEPVSNADAVTSASAADGESTNKITPVPRYDVVLANPPFRMPGWDEGGRLHFPYGEPPTHSATFAWLQYAAAILDDRGRAALVMPTSAAASENPTERRLRAKMTENGAVECVIAMPGELFRENDLDVAVWILRGKDHRSRRDVLLIDARALGTRRRRGRRILTDDDTAKIVGAYRSWRDSAAHTFNTIPGFAVAVDMQQLRVHDWQLNPAVHLHSGLPHADAGATRAKARALHEELLSCEYRARQADADVAHLLAWITP